MNKSLTTYVTIAIVAIIPAISFADAPSTDSSPAVTAQESTADVTTPSKDGNQGSTAGASAPSIDPQDSTAGVSTPSKDGNQGSTAGASTPSKDGAQGSTAGTYTTPAPSTSPVVNNGSSSSGSSSSGGSSGGIASIVYSSNCPLITSYMKLGGNNDSTQVKALQSFLKNVEGLNVEINGTFDQKTFDAVVAFQNKYSAETMGPWGASVGTGSVYLTTTKKINEIACKIPLNLNSAELSIINGYKNGSVSTATVAGPAISTVTINASTSPATITVTSGDIGQANASGTVETNTAAVGNTSILGRFWNFIVGMFK